MDEPQIKIVAISNVFTRLMHFIKKGDVEIGHIHKYDHATMVSSGSVLVEVLDGPDGNAVASKEFKAPGYVFIDKDRFHRLTALEDNTVCVCIHALRTIDENIIPSDTFIEPFVSEGYGEDIANAVKSIVKCESQKFIILPKQHAGGHHGT